MYFTKMSDLAYRNYSKENDSFLNREKYKVVAENADSLFKKFSWVFLSTGKK